MLTSDVTKRIKVECLSLIEYAGRVHTYDQRVLIAGEILGFMPLVFKMEFLVNIHVEVAVSMLGNVRVGNGAKIDSPEFCPCAMAS